MLLTNVNRWGRKPGRGIRPWLLIPKIIAVGFYIGGLASALMIWLGNDFTRLAATDARRLWVINLTGRLMEWMVVPSLVLAVMFGVALFLQHPREFIRMRWLLVKLASLLILIPSAHLFLSSRLAILREAFAHQTANDWAARQFGWGLSLALAASIWVVILGRLKPRLRQNWAKTFSAIGK